ncbi:MAG: hypothetical protein JST00_33555 [Deltaproteobacteria bacterium]|nr:hypothetical protein [Deltaproteobacteria bacterium]
MSDEELREEELREPEPNATTRALGEVTSEAKAHLEPTLSDETMKSIEDRLFARIAEEPRAAEPIAAPSQANDELAAARAKRQANVLRLGAVVLAAAAAVALVVKRTPDPDPSHATTTPPAAAPQEAHASALRATEGSGTVRVGGVAVQTGHVLRSGDLLEADGARAVLERPRKVTWLLEQNDDRARDVARARVKAAGETLVLGLDDGAIEAQVTPVPSGEAFAVDVGAGDKLVRFAVHGTHLRVARTGTKVVVDLTEGVIAIGVPPVQGITTGAEVRAPAHVELDVTDLEGTMKITHDGSKIRAAVPLVDGRVVSAKTASAGTEPTSPSPQGTGLKVSAVPRPSNLPPLPLAPDPKTPPVPPREAIANAVKACAKKHTKPSDVRVTITSSLRIKVTPGGDVETAQFDPPLLPEIQTCAAMAIYKAKLEAQSEPQMVTIPIEFSY